MIIEMGVKALFVVILFVIIICLIYIIPGYKFMCFSNECSHNYVLEKK